MRLRSAGRLLGVGLVVIWVALPASAHTRSRSDSWWTLGDAGAAVRLRMSRLDVSRVAPEDLGEGADGLAAHLADQLVMKAGGVPCPRVGAPRPAPAREGWVAWRWQVVCPGPDSRVIESTLLKLRAPSHLHFARVETGEGEVREALLAGDERRFELANAGVAGAEPAASGIPDYLRLGFGHILTGWDHLAFVLALLLLAGSARELAVLVTSFTLAHSVTLALAVTGWVRPEPGGIEAMIGYSVALVAAENAWLLSGGGRAIPSVLVGGLAVLAAASVAGLASLPFGAAAGLALFTACHFGLLARSPRPARLRAAVAFGFGLIHGFGFAGILAELELPTPRLAPALLGFNLGVEAGQLAVVALCWPVLRTLATYRPAAHRLTAELGSATIAALGTTWLLTRL